MVAATNETMRAHHDRERDDDDDGRSGGDGAADSSSPSHSGHVEGDVCSAGTLYGTRWTLPCSVSAPRRESQSGHVGRDTADSE